MTTQAQLEPTQITVERGDDYRENYANSVQVRVTMWDFFLAFGVIHQDTPETATVTNKQGIFLSPQQAKALWNVLGQNLGQYEQAFGPLSLEVKEQQATQALQ